MVKAGMLRTKQIRFQKERQCPEEPEHFFELLLTALVAFDRLGMDGDLVETMFTHVATANAVYHVRAARAVQLPKA